MMSGRYYDLNKGSSRSTRDDSRRREKRSEERVKRRSRSRSRSPKRHSPRKHGYSPDRSSSSRETARWNRNDKDSRNSPENWEDEEEIPAPPPPPRITKISIGFTKPKAPIKMNLSTPIKAPATKTVASVFSNDDDEEEPEEMPAEAKMRMRNIGRETPTSAGPNSFGKTKQGFCDSKKVFEKNLKHALETVEKPNIPKLPQTIYKINP